MIIVIISLTVLHIDIIFAILLQCYSRKHFCDDLKLIHILPKKKGDICKIPDDFGNIGYTKNLLIFTFEFKYRKRYFSEIFKLGLWV